MKRPRSCASRMKRHLLRRVRVVGVSSSVKGRWTSRLRESWHRSRSRSRTRVSRYFHWPPTIQTTSWSKTLSSSWRCTRSARTDTPSMADLPRLYRELASWFHLLTQPAHYAEEAEFARDLLA